MTLADIAKKFNVTIEYLKEQLSIGTKYEIEYGVEEESAEQIARDNITANPSYYESLLGE
jgi:Zn-dependent peptidase ImmA (M78 family)